MLKCVAFEIMLSARCWLDGGSCTDERFSPIVEILPIRSIETTK